MNTAPLLVPNPRHLRLLTESGAATASPALETRGAAGGGQGYRLRIAGGKITIVAEAPAGFFYARQTLAQLVEQYPSEIPAMEIEDWPDFPVRGVMLDISRDKVPTMASLYALVDELAKWKINQFQLYTEHTFAYRGHEKVWRESSPMTPREVRDLDAYCRQRFIELVPNQNSFGHLERWLTHPEYAHLAEAPHGGMTPWGTEVKTPFSLCPADARSVEFLRGLYAELLPNFSSRLFNVGCDETWDVGQGRSKEEVERVGATRVYLEFLKKVHTLVTEQGRTMMFWGDIILHQPDLVSELPRPIIALAWGYEAESPFDQNGAAFARAGIPFYVCPGTSSWCSIAGRTDNCIANLKNAAVNGLKHSACGYLITDWGDHGHLQYHPVSYLGYVAGAAYSWCYETNRDLPMADVLSRVVLRDAGGVIGQVACDLGNVYQACGQLTGNASLLFRVLLAMDPKNPAAGIGREQFENTLRAIDRAIAPLSQARMARADGQLIRDEYANAAAILRFACHRGLAVLEGKSPSAKEREALVQEHQRLWLCRNREGGLRQSVHRLESGSTDATA